MLFKTICNLFLFISIFQNNSFAKQNFDSAVAKVNNKIITNFEIEDRYKFLIKFVKVKISSKREKEIFINQMIDKMINEELIRQEAKNLGIEISQVEIDALIEDFAFKQGKSLKSLKEFFAQNNISFQNYQKQVEADLMWSKIVTNSLRSKIKITDLEIREFLEQMNQETDIIKYKISEIFIPNKKDAQIFANKIYQDLKSGADFEYFVKQFSQSPTSQNNGEIGWVSKSDINIKIYNGISQIPLKSYSEPIFLTDGYYIFKVLDKKIVNEINQNDRDFARNRIFIKELEIEGKAYLMEIHKKSFIEIYHDKIFL